MILLAYGTRPEYIKIKPLIDIFEKEGFSYKTLFTGQHKDLLKEFVPDYEAQIHEFDGGNRLDAIIASILDFFSINKGVLDGVTHVLVQGDTTSVLAVALSAFHRGIKVIHLEAGLRTYDRENPYPEEINRRIVSQIADIHLCPTEANRNNLWFEKIVHDDIYVVGNTGLDNLSQYKEKCEYTNKILVTLHRRENHHWMNDWFIAVDTLAEWFPEYEFILPIHPNPNVQKHKHLLTHVNIIDPLPHKEMLDLLVKAKMVITDSGGLQEECSFFNKKCLTCRKVTERPEAIGQSTVMVESPDLLVELFNKEIKKYEINYNSPFGDGHSAEKVYQILKRLI
jgi:UDP-N-acetylglucosamine 2-epimerase (non-hydrolysing)